MKNGPVKNIVGTVMPSQLWSAGAKDWPADYGAFSGDDSRNIRNMLTTCEQCMAVAVMIISWRPRSDRYPGRGRIGSFLTGILVLGAFGRSTCRAFAPILSVGLLVDGAIVVTEYAAGK